jgi:hypothetical protein
MSVKLRFLISIILLSNTKSHSLMNDITKYFLGKNYKKRVVICTYFARLFMILIKKYEEDRLALYL